MQPVTRERLTFMALFCAYCAAVALRTVYTRPPELWWFVGLVAAAAACFTAGYFYRAGYIRRRFQRQDRHNG